MPDPPTPAPTHAALARGIGVWAAVTLGLGSMIGTGVYVALGLAAGYAGDALLLAVGVAGLLAFCNALSSAQLAAAFPVAGGTYEYGHRTGLAPLGTLAGVMFVVAKSASAATAALGAASYGLGAVGVELPARWVALGAVAVVTAVVLGGLKRTAAVNAGIVVVTLAGLGAFMFAALGADTIPTNATTAAATADEAIGVSPFFTAVALAFVAFTGYGRVATLGEEVRDPARTIPRAIVATMTVTVLLYLAVAGAALRVVEPAGYASLARAGRPLEAIAEAAGAPAWVVVVITVGAVTAMLGVLLNLVLGVSRVVLAMGRRGHLPRGLAGVNTAGTTPTPAVLVTAGVTAALTLTGSVSAAWSLSAATVLIYYGITNAAALRLPRAQRRYPQVFAWAGLVGCVGLAAFVPWQQLAIGAAVAVVALGWHAVIAARSGDGRPVT